MTLIESINRTRDLAGMKPLSEAQVNLLTEALSKDTKEWVKAEFGDKGEVKGNKILLTMPEDEYNKGLAKLLMKFDMFCPQQSSSKDWSGSYKDGVATLGLY